MKLRLLPEAERDLEIGADFEFPETTWRKPDGQIARTMPGVRSRVQRASPSKKPDAKEGDRAVLGWYRPYLSLGGSSNCRTLSFANYCDSKVGWRRGAHGYSGRGRCLRPRTGAWAMGHAHSTHHDAEMQPMWLVKRFRLAKKLT
jgi:hypothetical protein